MSFRLRFLLRIVKWLFEKPISVHEQYRGEYRVWPTEAEISVVENARYGYLLVLERFRLVFSSGLIKHMLKNNWTTVMGTQIYKVKRPLRRFQKFTTITNPLYWDDKWFYFEQRIESEGKLVCSAVISVIFLAKDRKIPPQEILSVMKISTKSPEFSPKIKNFIAAADVLES